MLSYTAIWHRFPCDVVSCLKKENSSDLPLKACFGSQPRRPRGTTYRPFALEATPPRSYCTGGFVSPHGGSHTETSSTGAAIQTNYCQKRKTSPRGLRALDEHVRRREHKLYMYTLTRLERVYIWYSGTTHSYPKQSSCTAAVPWFAEPAGPSTNGKQSRWSWRSWPSCYLMR